MGDGSMQRFHSSLLHALIAIRSGPNWPLGQSSHLVVEHEMVEDVNVQKPQPERPVLVMNQQQSKLEQAESRAAQLEEVPAQVQIKSGQQRKQAEREVQQSPWSLESLQENLQAQQFLQELFIKEGVEFQTFFNEMSNQFQGQRTVALNTLKDIISVFFKSKKVKALQSQARVFFQGQTIDEAAMLLFSKDPQCNSNVEAVTFQDVFKILKVTVRIHKNMRLSYQQLIQPAKPVVKTIVSDEEIRAVLEKGKELLQLRLGHTKQPKSVKIMVQTINSITVQLQSLRPSTVTNQVANQSPLRKQSFNQRLKILFQFYCRSSYPQNKKNTFDAISQQSAYLNLKKFISFCNDFKMLHENVQHKKLVLIFRKNAKNQLSMDLHGFQTSLKQIALQRPGQMSESLKVHSYLSQLLDKNIRKKLKEIHKDPFRMYGDLRTATNLPAFVSSAHTGKLPVQIDQQLQLRKKFRQRVRLSAPKSVKSKLQTLTSLNSSHVQLGPPVKLINLKNLRESNADKSILQSLISQSDKHRMRNISVKI